MGAVALFGLLAYLFTPLSAAGAEGAPVGFGINIRYAIPALLLGLTLLPAAYPAGGRNLGYRSPSRVVLRVLACSCRARAHGPLRRGPARPGAAVAWRWPSSSWSCPAGLLLARARGAGRGGDRSAGSPRSPCSSSRSATRCSAHYLERPLPHDGPEKSHPRRQPRLRLQLGTRLGDARIGLAGTTAGFLQYGFYGTDLSNRVIYLGEKGPHGAYNAIPTCAAFRTAVNAADLDYLVTTPFLNFIHTGTPIPSPEASWLRSDPAASQ